MATQYKKKVSSPFLIGLFVITGVIIMVSLLIWFGATKFMEEQTFYVTYFDGSVEGLQKGTPVKYLGVPSGSIQGIEIAPDGKLIEVIMQIDKNIIINDSLRVKAELAGIAGGKFLQLFYPIDEDLANMYPKLSFKPPYPVVRSAPSGIEEITIAAREVMNNLMELEVKDISKETVGMLSASRKFFESDSLYSILHNLKNSGKRLNNILTQADTSNIIDNLAYSGDRVRIASDNLVMLTDTLNRQIENMQLDRLASKVYNEYDTTMAHTNRVIGVVGYRMENLIFSLTETFEEIRETNKELQRSLRAISDNPTQVFFSEPPKKKK
ncbi:MAG: MlaD family protein [Candidatus Kapaibacterium sp.]